MTSGQVKRHLESYYLWQRNFIAVLFEMELVAGYKADVVAITPERALYEIEIKTARADFLGEVNAIKYVLEHADGAGSKSLFSGGGVFFCQTERAPEQKNIRKPGKHNIYLNKGAAHYKTELMPSRFYYCLPYEMIKELNAPALLEGTPYGLIDCQGHMHRPAKRIGTERISEDALIMLMRKMSRDNLKLREAAKPATS